MRTAHFVSFEAEQNRLRRTRTEARIVSDPAMVLDLLKDSYRRAKAVYLARPNRDTKAAAIAAKRAVIAHRERMA